MSLMEKLISKNSSCSTLKSGSGSQGYTPIQGTLKNNNLPCNPNVTFVTNVTCQLNQDVTEYPKEWFSALEIFEKVHVFGERLFDQNPDIYSAIESNPVLLKTEENMDSLAIQIRKEASEEKRQALLEQLTTAGRFYCKKLKAINSTL